MARYMPCIPGYFWSAIGYEQDDYIPMDAVEIQKKRIYLRDPKAADEKQKERERRAREKVETSARRAEAMRVKMR